MATNSDRIKEGIRRALDAGSSLSKMSRRELEETFRSFGRNVSPAKDHLEDAVDDVRARSRRGADHVADMVMNEMRHELGSAARRGREDLANLFDRASELFGDLRSRPGPHASSEESTAATEEAAPETPAHPKRPAAKRAPAKRAPARAEGAGSGTKKTAAKRTAAKKQPSKAPPAKSRTQGAKRTPPTAS